MTRGPRPFNGERIIVSTNGARTPGYTQAKEGIWIPTSHHTQKLTENDQRFKCKSQNFKALRRKHRSQSSWKLKPQWITTSSR